MKDTWFYGDRFQKEHCEKKECAMLFLSITNLQNLLPLYARVLQRQYNEIPL